MFIGGEQRLIAELLGVNRYPIQRERQKVPKIPLQRHYAIVKLLLDIEGFEKNHVDFMEVEFRVRMCVSSI